MARSVSQWLRREHERRGDRVAGRHPARAVDVREGVVMSDRMHLLRQLRVASRTDPRRCSPECPGLLRSPSPWCGWYFHSVEGTERRRHSYCEDDQEPLTDREISRIVGRARLDRFMESDPPRWLVAVVTAIMLCGTGALAIQIMGWL